MNRLQKQITKNIYIWNPAMRSASLIRSRLRRITRQKLIIKAMIQQVHLVNSALRTSASLMKRKAAADAMSRGNKRARGYKKRTRHALNSNWSRLLSHPALRTPGSHEYKRFRRRFRIPTELFDHIVHKMTRNGRLQVGETNEEGDFATPLFPNQCFGSTTSPLTRWDMGHHHRACWGWFSRFRDVATVLTQVLRNLQRRIWRRLGPPSSRGCTVAKCVKRLGQSRPAWMCWVPRWCPLQVGPVSLCGATSAQR